MKKRILSLFLALVTVFYILPIGAIPAIALGESEETGIEVANMEVGKLYSAKWDYSTYPDTYLYKLEDNQMANYDSTVMKEDLPQDLIVKLVEEGDIYVYVTNNDWPEEIESFRFVEAAEIIITGEYTPPADDGYIYGKVDINCTEAIEGTVFLEKGEKVHAFTSLDIEVSDSAKYQWQIKVDEDRWATITDYIYPYAAISEALILNAPGGRADIRCIVTDGYNKYASDTLGVEIKENVEAYSSYSALANADGDTTDGDDGIMTSGFEIIIKYTFRHATNGTIDTQTAANMFSITLPENSSYSGTVTSPPVIGYSPYTLYDPAVDTEVDTSTLLTYDGVQYKPQPTYTFTNQSTKAEISIVYIPKLVDFIVIHQEQNLQNDEYTPYNTEVLQGYTDSEVGENLADSDKLANGFTALFYDPKTLISASGTTVEIYYDRIYYLVDFNLDEGYGIAPYYVRYGTQISLGTPTKPGYAFNSWKLTSVYTKDEDENKVYMPEADWPLSYSTVTPTTQITIKHNLDYQAVWDISTTTYTVIYWVENADDDGFTLDSFEVVDGVAPNSVVSAGDTLNRTDKACFIFNEGRSDQDVIVKGDGTTAVNVYYNRKYINLVFVGTGNCAYTHTHGDGTCVAPLNCGIENTHIHNESCGEGVLTCEVPEHTHVESCRTNCTLTEHTAHTIDCLNCSITSHQTHTASCYDGAGNVSSNQSDINGTKSDGYIGRYGTNDGWGALWGDYDYFIYINGSWYEYTGSVKYNNQASPKTGCLLTHAHESSCYKDSLHTHSLACCGMAEHTHTENKCYTFECGTKYHEHTDSCYGECTKFVHTHTNAANCSSKYVKVVTEKYDAEISDIWPIVDNNGYEYKDSGWWQSSITDKYYTILYKMPEQDITMTFSSASGNTYTWDYSFEQLDGSYAVDFSASVKGREISLTYEEDYFPITGFTQRDSDVPEFSNRQATLYYTRNSYNLIFHDGERQVFSQPFKYEADISAASNLFELQTPNSKEVGSVKFAGWYTTPTCADGTDFDFDGQTMPARNLTLYAKWEDMTYDVEVYLDKEQTNLATPNSDEYESFPVTVKFGDRIAEPIRSSSDSSYIFAGWYYKENGTEKRFDFNTMTIKKNYINSGDENNTAIYAKWTSQVPVPYVVYYQLKDGTNIADPTRGEALAGTYKSFNAKVGAQLYDGYQAGNYPDERSKNVAIVDDGNRTENEIYFIYSELTEINYTVNHTFTSDDFTSIIGTNTFDFTMTGKETNTSENPVSASMIIKFSDGVTKSAVISQLQTQIGKTLTTAEATEVWETILSLSPSAFQQELILTSDDSQNVVTFEWEGLGLTGIYQVVHHFQTVDGNSYVAEYTQEFVGNYNSTYSATPMTVTGFKVNETESGTALTGEVFEKLTTDSNGEVSGGLVLNVYYDRLTYWYSVVHNLYTDSGVQPEVIGKFEVPYETTVTVEATERTNYYVVGNTSQTHTIVTGSEDAPFEIVFEYMVFEVLYFYQILPSEAGYIKDNYYTETVDAGTLPNGATPVVYKGWVFVGWYTDAACTVPVTDAVATIDPDTNAIQPLAPTVDQDEMALYFYAKCIPTTRVFKNAGSIDANQAVIYRLQGKSTDNNTKNTDITFVITGTGSITLARLPYGAYTLTVMDWSWRYGDPTVEFNSGTVDGSGGTYDLTLDVVGDVTFKFDAATENKWITDDAYGTVTPTVNP